MQQPHILALDFDGVLCDGLQEYFQTACRTYQQVWSAASLSQLAERFYRLRPVIETGWEMPVLLRALVLGVADTEILANWSAIAQPLVEDAGLDPRDLAQRLDTTRDRWLQTDLAGWLSLHRFYPGIREQLQTWLAAGTPELFIITTKEGRFVQQLLSEQGIMLPATSIFGKEVKQPKAATLRQLQAAAAV
ncbi:MAG: HAD family hydrolase [Spirulinaceae cyanobacterium RM2_2_10]|nr:HAD family hydrolase [Spirulinaceae cyanobacterium RM2_2_10]